MGMLSKYIDGLTDEQRDRIVRATDWQAGRFFVDGQPACPVAHAVGIDEKDYVRSMRRHRDPFAGTQGAYKAFDHAARRFGHPRVVRAVKLRAARGNRIDLGEPTTDAPVSAGQHARL